MVGAYAGEAVPACFVVVLEQDVSDGTGVAEEVEDWVWEHLDSVAGTAVFMKLRNETRRTTKEGFDRFLSGDDYAVTETVVPVRAVRHGDEQLVSRSQAKRLLARVEQFRTVRLDFIRIDAIGPAFADEIFRVFALRHPDVELVAINANADVERMIARAKSSELVRNFVCMSHTMNYSKGERYGKEARRRHLA